MSSPEGSNRNASRPGRVDTAGGSGGGNLTPEHYLLILQHRKWFILTVFLFVSAGTAIVSYLLPDVYTSQTLILVDPQQVPLDYIKPTVSGDVRDRLSTLSQQILSTTRLQSIIDKFKLYVEERRTQPLEEIVDRMRLDTTVEVASGLGASTNRRNEET